MEWKCSAEMCYEVQINAIEWAYLSSDVFLDAPRHCIFLHPLTHTT